tara:strand:- start:999 stop:1457 length:459 start_codon:yes stop_codon:yes gene_type:complete
MIPSIRILPLSLFSKFNTINQLYHTSVIDHYENPRNIGSLDKDDNNVGTGLVGAPACGDVMKLNIRVNDEGIITESKFKTFGCGSAIAASSLATEWIKNKHINDAYLVTNKEIAKELKLPPVKLHCSMLAQDAIQSAIEDYINKNDFNKIHH